MLLCVAAVCKAENSIEYAVKHKEILTRWTDYLVSVGWNPENQLCTDDFAGHLAHNCNLSIKGILGIAAWAKLLGQMGEKEQEQKYRAEAEKLAREWEKAAFDGDHYRLTFDGEGTWSLKYNLVWDTLLDLNVFDRKVAETEVKYYLTKMNPYGIPLDFPLRLYEERLGDVDHHAHRQRGNTGIRSSTPCGRQSATWTGERRSRLVSHGESRGGRLPEQVGAGSAVYQAAELVRGKNAERL